MESRSVKDDSGINLSLQEQNLKILDIILSPDIFWEKHAHLATEEFDSIKSVALQNFIKTTKEGMVIGKVFEKDNAQAQSKEKWKYIKDIGARAKKKIEKPVL